MSTQLDTLRAFVAARPAPRPRGQGHVIAVAGGKGGIGTSTLATLLAWAAARQGRETLLVDAAGGAGSLHQVLGVAPHGDPIDAPPTALRAGLTLIAAASPVGAGPGERTARFRRIASTFADHDLVVVDAGNTMDGVLLTAAAAGGLIAVTALDRVAIAAAYALLKVAGHRFPTLPMGVLANRCTEADGAAAFERIGTGALRFLGHAVGYAGAIPEDDTLRTAADDGRLFDGAIHGTAAAAADAFVARLLHNTGSRSIPYSLSRV